MRPNYIIPFLTLHSVEDKFIEGTWVEKLIPLAFGIGIESQRMDLDLGACDWIMVVLPPPPQARGSFGTRPFWTIYYVDEEHERSGDSCVVIV